MQNINSSKNIVIIDYEMSNLFSVVRACQKVGFNPVVTNDHKMIKKADAIILPGKATSRMSAQSIAHVLMVVFIILGNISYYILRKRIKNA